MHLSYGFISNGAFGVCHLHNCTTEDDTEENYSKWRSFFEDPRFKAGKTKVMMHFDDQCAYLNFEEIMERAEFIKQYEPGKIGIFVCHEIAIETAKIGASFLRDRGVIAEAFDNLDELFRWMELD